jgi:hypothetical protein
VEVDGSTEVQPEQTCTWNAIATGGEPPYSFEWYVDGDLEDNTSEFQYEVGQESFGLEVIVCAPGMARSAGNGADNR